MEGMTLKTDEKSQRKELHDEFLRIAKQTKEDFRESLKGLNHPGELGKARENILKEFLQHFLPEPFEIGTGFVIDAEGQRSEQIDLIIFDKTLSRGIGLKGGVKYFPCESVAVVGEVKTTITSKDKFKESLGRIESVKKLVRFPKKYPFRLLPAELRVIGFIFTSKALARDTMYEELVNYCSSRPRSLWPNVIVDFENYLISYFNKGMHRTTLFPDNADEWYTTSESQQDVIILLFTCYLAAQLISFKKRHAPDLLEYFGVKETEVSLLGPVPKYTGI
jgi:hypothetical protein